MKQYVVYVLTNKRNTVLYTGISSKLDERLQQHLEKVVKSFTSKYNVNKLIYYEIFEDPISAISREKQIKSWSRKRKEDLIKGMNPEWEDLVKKYL